MASPTVRASSQDASSITSSINVPRPTGTVDGDLLVALVSTYGANTITTPDGWTKVAEATSGTDTGDARLAVFIRRAGPSEPSSYTFEASAAQIGAIVSALVDAGDVDVFGSDVGNLSTDAVGPSVTTTVADVLLIGGYGNRNNAAGQWTPPSGMTERGDTSAEGNVGVTMQLATEPIASTGATGTRTAVCSESGDWAAIHVAIGPLNVAPNAPTDLAPDGVTIDRTILNRFTWTFSDPNSGDSQSKYDLRYRVSGTSTWTDVTGTTSDEFHDFAADTFAADDWEWQVRTYDSADLVGPYSASVFFTAETPPVAPTWVDPVDLDTVANPEVTVELSHPDNPDRLQIRVTDGGSTIYSDTGSIAWSTTAQVEFPAETNNLTVTLEARVRKYDLWSDWEQISVDVVYTPPATPTCTVDLLQVNGRDAALRVSHTNPAPTGSQPTVTSVEVYRRVVGDTDAGIRIAIVDPDADHDDYTVAHLVDYQYRVRAIADDDTASVSAWVDEITLTTGVDSPEQFISGGAP